MLSKLRTKALALSQTQHNADGSTETHKSKLITAYGLKEVTNPMLTLFVDVFRWVKLLRVNNYLSVNFADQHP